MRVDFELSPMVVGQSCDKGHRGDMPKKRGGLLLPWGARPNRNLQRNGRCKAHLAAPPGSFLLAHSNRVSGFKRS